MELHYVEATNFQSWGRQRFDATDRLHLIVGANGAGKSTLVEAIHWARTGRLLRAPRDQPGPEARVKLGFALAGEEWEIERWRTAKGSPRLRVVVDGESRDQATPSATQAWLDHVLGSTSRFASSTIFAREFLTKIGAATDKELKALLEEAFNLPDFTAAHAAARSDLSAEQKARQRLEGQLAQLRQDIATAEGSITRYEAQEQPPEGIFGEIEKTKSERTKAAAHYDELRQLRRAQATATEEARAALREIQAEVNGVTRLRAEAKERLAKDRCPHCDQDITEEAKERLREGYRRIVQERYPRATKAALSEATAYAQEEEEALAEYDTAMQRAQKQVDAIDARLNALAPQAEARRDYDTRLEMLRATLEERRTRYATAEAEAAAADARCRELRLTVDVLGTKGARNLLFRRAVGVFADHVNYVLHAIASPHTVRIETVAQRKDGSEVDEISIQLDGPDRTAKAYRHASSGERARLDVAFLLALARIDTPNPEDRRLVLFDEVFDALDTDGVERVSRYLDSLAQEQQVVVISHHTDLIDLFRGGAVYRATKDPQQGTQLHRVR